MPAAESDYPSEQKAIRWYPPSYDIRVETVSVPQCEYFFLSRSYLSFITISPHRIQHPDDAIVKVKVTIGCQVLFVVLTKNHSLLPFVVTLSFRAAECDFNITHRKRPSCIQGSCRCKQNVGC
jgi:hypothetical protein